MSVKIIAGRADTGKSSLIYNEINNLALDSKDNLILIVPELMTYQAEHDYIRQFDLAGIMNVEILSFKRLETKVLEEVGGLKVQDISVFGKIMLLKQLFEENRDKLKIFNNSYKQAGFLKEFENLMTEFKQNLVDCATLKKAAAGVDDELLMRKLSDIELIYSQYVERTANKYFDEEDKTDLFISLIKESAFIRNSKIWIDGFESFNRQRLKLLKNLSLYSKSLTISLNADPAYFDNLEENDDWEAFKIICDTYESLRRILETDIEIRSLKENKSPSLEIKAIEKSIMSIKMEEFSNETDRIKIFSSLNPYRETQKAAAEIISLVRDHDYRWRDIKVAAGNMDTYETYVKRVFTQYQIPFFLDSKRDIMNNPLCKYILSILDMFIWNFKHDNVFEYLKTGFSPLSLTQVNCLENYALQYGIEGGKWFKEFKPLEKENKDERSSEEEAAKGLETEEYRKLFADDFDRERREINSFKRVSDITKLIFTYLKKHQVREKMEKAVKGFNGVQKYEEASEYSQCWNYVMEIFEQLLLVGQDTEISLKDYRLMLEAGLSQVEVSLIPPAIDKVEVGDIDRIAVTRPRALFILGGNDSNLDSKNTEKGLLLNEERDRLLANEVKLTKGADYDTFKEKHMLYKLFSSPSDRFSISYPLGLATGESLQPSLYIDSLKKIFINVKEGSDLGTSNGLDLISGYRGTYDFFVENMRNFIDGYPIDDLWKDVYTWYEKEDKENFHIINRALKYKNSMASLDADTINRIYQNNMTMTVSKLESYAECQFKYFMENVMKPRERIIQKIEFYDLGNIYHTVVEKFINKINEEYKDISLLNRDEAEKEAVKITDDVLTDLADKVTALEANQRNKYMKEKIKRVMKRTCWTLVRQLQAGDFRPKYTELQIDIVDKNDEKAQKGIYLSPIEIPVETEKIKEVLRLRGKIDRVDVFENKDKLYINIIDYKSSPNNIDLDDAAEGLQVQLIMYLKALLDHGRELFGKEPDIGGVFYYYINDPVYKDDNKSKDPEEEIFKSLKLRGYLLRDKDLVKFMDNNIGASSSVIPAALKNDGELREDWTKALSEDEFKCLIDLVYKKCAQMTKSILKGNININPYRKEDGMTPCKYCQYISICQFDKSLGNEFRHINKRDKDDILKPAKGGMEDGVD